MRKINKFYVGAAHIADALVEGANDAWTHATEAAAIRHAKEIVEDGEHDCAIVVQITHVVRRQTQPVTVERVR